MMRSLPAFFAASAAVALVGCASSIPVGVATPSAAVVAPADKAAPPRAEEQPQAKQNGSLDPLAMDVAFEAANIPKVEQTPAKQLRPKSRGELEAALRVLDSESSFEGALKKVTARLGKPTWVENGKKRVWIAKDGKQCHRFVLDDDGQADFETAPMTEWRMLSALAQQNACTGEIRRGTIGSP